MRKRLTLTGNDGAWLALAAQSRHLKDDPKLQKVWREIRKGLRKEAMPIYIAIMTGKGSKSDKQTAKAFTDWADNLSSICTDTL